MAPVAAVNGTEEVQCVDESKEVLMYSFVPLPLVFVVALPGAMTVRSLFGPFVELVKSWNLPDWLVHWEHPGNMAVVLGGYGTYLGFRIRFSDDVDMKYQLEKNSSEAQPECKYNLCKSLAWDSAFFTNPGVIDQEELFETLDFRARDDKSTITSAEVQAKLFPFEYKEERISGSTRKSLAWDSAFFTSPGVLDDEELCIVNRGFRRSKALALPAAKGEIWQSIDSTTSVLGDTYSLSSLYIDLFDNITTSMHNEPLSSAKRETKNGPTTSKVAHSSSAVKRNDAAASCGKSHKPPKILAASQQQLSSNQMPPFHASCVKPEKKVTRSAPGKELKNSSHFQVNKLHFST